MENRSTVVAAAAGPSGVNSVLQIRDEWRLAREAHKDLQTMGMPRTNLLLVGTAGATRIVMEMLWLELREPVLTWRPGERLQLPPIGRAATLVLQDVRELTRDDQHRVLRWLDETAGRIRVVTTTSAASG